MVPWHRLKQMFLDEVLRREGLADALDENKCPCCETTYTQQSRRFRCMDCGMFVQCGDCARARHSLHPLHRLKVRDLLFSLTTGSDPTAFRSGMEITGCRYPSRNSGSYTNWVMAGCPALLHPRRPGKW
jgi:hypothetical protein